MFCHPALLIQSGPPPNVTDSYVTSQFDAVNRSVYTFTDLAVGLPAARRTAVICVGMRNNTNGDAPTISGITLDGNAMTLGRQKGRTASGEPNPGAALYYLAWPTGTLATFVITFTQVMLQCGVMTHRLMDAAAIHYATKSEASSSSGLNLSCNIEAGGCMISTACQKPAGTQGFNPDIEDGEMDFGTSTMISGHKEREVAATPYTLNASGNGNDDAGVSVSWSKR